MDDIYTVPLSTFWRPVEIGEYVEDPKTVTKLTSRNSIMMSNFAEDFEADHSQYLS